MQEWLTIITVAVCVVIAIVAVFRRRSCGCSSESCGESSCCDCELKKECDKNKSKKS